MSRGRKIFNVLSHFLFITKKKEGKGKTILFLLKKG